MCRGSNHNAATNHSSAGMTVVEVIVAYVLLSVGLLAASAISLHAGAHSRMGTWQSDQALAAQQEMDRLQPDGYATVGSGTTTAAVGTRWYRIDRRVGMAAPGVKSVQLTVTAISSSRSAQVPSRTFETRLYENRRLPSAP